MFRNAEKSECAPLCCEQRPEPENQDSQHMLNQPRGSYSKEGIGEPRESGHLERCDLIWGTQNLLWHNGYDQEFFKQRYQESGSTRVVGCGTLASCSS